MSPKTCPSLSGRSTLSYVVEDNNLRIVSNSGRGLYDPTPVSVTAIEQALDKAHPKTSALKGLFTGKSSNTAGFVLAAYLDHKRSVK